LITDLPIGYVRIEMSLTNFPVQLTSFIGREREIADIKRLLFTSHLFTLTGAGGSGKTRLAIQIANEVNDTFADGVWFVDLAPLHDPALVLTVVARAFGLLPAVDQPLMEMLLGFVRSKQLLLILDNCEHLTDACAQLAQELLSQTPELRILATSREPLAIAGETIYPVSGLLWPSTHEGVEGNPEDLVRFDAVRLFVDRARSISPDFNLTSKNTAPTVEICRRLDGLPLALELASARVQVLTVHEIAARLNDRFALLISGQRRGFEARHQTLRAAIDWSYDLLKADEQALLRRMAVFEVGCTLDILEAIYSGDAPLREPILDMISSLVKKSLVVAETSGRTQVRYRLLETIREYLLEKLDQASETEIWRDRHLNLYLVRAEEGAPKLGGSYQQLWLNWFDDEIDNLRAALTWALNNGRESAPNSVRIESGLRIANTLMLYWQIRGIAQEGLTWFERLLKKVNENISTTVHVNAVAGASFLALFLGNGPECLRYGREAVRIAEAAGEVSNSILSFAQAGLSSGAKATGDFQTAFSAGERAVQLYREMGQTHYLSIALVSEGEVAFQMVNDAIARERWSESLSLAQSNRDAYVMATALNFLGDLARVEQNYTEAASKYQESADLFRELNAQYDLATVVNNLGFINLHLEKMDHAQTQFRESMDSHLVKQNKRGMTDCLIGFAAAAALDGLPAAGARLMAAVVAITSLPNGSTWRATQMEYERYLQLVRAALSETDFQAEQDIGRGMSLEQAVNYGLNLPFHTGAALEKVSPNPEPTMGLTGREREIAGWIAQGKTNSEIAAELVLSKRTVETHVSKILSKLGMTSRAQIMRWVIDHGLIQTKA
jgi:non-specific serine/threonine protein kinase